MLGFITDITEVLLLTMVNINFGVIRIILVLLPVVFSFMFLSSYFLC